MTRQRVFPFIINGQFWKNIEIDKDRIKMGYIVIPVMTKICGYLDRIDYPNQMAKMKQVRFQLAEICEATNKYKATWFPGFWAVDDCLYLDNGKLYLRD